MERLPLRLALIASLVLSSVIPAALAAQATSRAFIGPQAGANLGQPSIPPFVEQQLQAKARAENPPLAGLHLSEDGESYTYASPASGVAPGQSGADGYQATLGRRLSGGIEISAGQSDLSLKFWPVNDALFVTPAVEEGGRLVYTGRGVRYEYTFKRNGVKEDVVLESAPSKDVCLVFALRRDGSLDFKLDGRGNLLVYGPDAALSGFIQTGDDRSVELIMKARANARKDQLMYVIPAPVIVDGGGRQYGNMARYTLEGGALTLHTDDLSALASPVTIDPTIVVTTTADFATGNNEGMISFDTDAISRAVPGGAAVGAWTTTSPFTTARYSHSSVAYNGYVYILGGRSGSSYLNDVQFAPINPDGTVGAWSATTTFTTARAYHTSVTYNGYVYVIGGYNGTHFSDVQFAPINANGTLGAWSATSSFVTPRRTHKSVVYNGYVYILGGFAGGTTYFDDVQFAAIHADGTLGAWAATTSFPTGRYGHACVAYNGYLYVIGGYSGVYRSDVQFARIHADGTVGAWAATTSLPLPHFTSTAVAWNGYLYVMGGASAAGTYLNDVQVAGIRPNGSIGPWISTTNFSTPRYAHASVVYRGCLYVLGGNDGTDYSDVQYSTISAGPDGLVRPWATTGSFITARFGHTSVAHDGYLYVLGGQTSGGYVNTVQYAPVNADGTLGTWAITNPFTTARSRHASVVYNGYLYVIGGESSPGNPLNDVQVAPITSDGLVGVWTATTSFATARSIHASVAYNGYLYVIGGYNGSYLGDVQVAPINANGTVGTWTATTSFSPARSSHASVAYNGHLYVIGGYGNSGYLDDVRVAAINPTTGAVSAWSATTALPVPDGGHTSVVSNGCLYVIGGCNSSGCFLDDIWYAPLHADGTAGDWTATTSFATGRDLHTSVVCSGYLYILGGNSGSYLNDVQFAPIYDAGTAGAWAGTTGFTTARGGHTSVAFNGYLYVLGGWDGSSYRSDVQFAPINDNGTVGAWTATTSFTTGRSNHASVVYNGRVYVIGGWDGSNKYSDVQFAPINANGTLGAWTATTSFNTPRYYHASVAWHGYLYVIGGYDGTLRYNDVQFALIDASGGVGAWTTAASFTTARYGHSSVVYNGYLYVIGGNSSGSYLNDVQFAPLLSNGAVGTWTATAGFTYGRFGHASVARNGYLYVIGGYGSSSNVHLNDVQSAPIRSDGTLDAWQGTTRFTTARRIHSSVAYNGGLYVIGGYSGSTPLGDVLVAPLRGPEARGRYSKLLDIGSDQVVNFISFSNLGHDGATDLTYAMAPSATAVFGAPTTVQDAAAGSAHSTGPASCARYMWVLFDLDDSESATVDGGGSYGRGDLLAFSVDYSAVPTPTVTGPSNGCQGSTATLSTDSYSSYQWIKDGTDIPGETAQTYGATQTGSYRVRTTVGGGCTATSAAHPVTFYANPTPTVSGASSNACPAATVTLSTGAYASYQWNFNGGPIGGAMSATYDAAQTGNYSVSVTDYNGCTGTSANKAVTISACVVNLQYDGTFNPNATLLELCGNGDSVVEPGEQWRVTVRLVNTGNTNATNAAATLAVNAGSAVSASVAGNPGSFGTVAQGGGTATANYQFLVSGGAACVNNLTFDVTGIQSAEGSYSSQIAAFSTQVGSSTSQNETGTQQTSPLNATSNAVTSNFTPAFTLPSANSATLTCSHAYTPYAVTSTLFSDEFGVNPSSNGWTVSGTVTSVSTVPTDSCAGGGGNYANLSNAGASMARVVSTAGQTNVTVVLDHRYMIMNTGLGITVDYSTTGTGGPWTTQWSKLASGPAQSTNWGDDCARTIVFPASCENNPNFALRISSTGGVGSSVKVDHLKVTGDSVAGDWTASAKVELLDPASTATVLKAYGAADGSPYNVKAYYTGPGTYGIRLTESSGGTATLLSGSLAVNGTVTHCHVSSCGSGGPPPVGSGKSGTTPARFAKHAGSPSQIDVTYDATNCSGQKAVILYGNIGAFSGYAGCAQSDAGNSGTATIDGTGLANVWFNVVWANGTTAGHPGYAFNGSADVARTWPAVGHCGLSADDGSHGTCP